MMKFEIHKERFLEEFVQRREMGGGKEKDTTKMKKLPTEF